MKEAKELMKEALNKSRGAAGVAGTPGLVAHDYVTGGTEKIKDNVAGDTAFGIGGSVPGSVAGSIYGVVQGAKKLDNMKDAGKTLDREIVSKIMKNRAIKNSIIGSLIGFSGGSVLSGLMTDDS